MSERRPSTYDRLTIPFSVYPVAEVGRVWGENAWTLRISNFGPSPIERAARAFSERTHEDLMSAPRPQLRLLKGGQA